MCDKRNLGHCLKRGRMGGGEGEGWGCLATISILMMSLKLKPSGDKNCKLKIEISEQYKFVSCNAQEGQSRENIK